MASVVEKSHLHPQSREQGTIPVFTVLKNGAIIKNIFILNNNNNNPPPSQSIASIHHSDDILFIGRHPDCNIVLTHPSISRFHLQIRSAPSSHTLFVVDLSSVHGTWVSGRKLEPGVSVELKEGDTLRIGVSSRVYRLHWFPTGRAYDLESPFVSELDVGVKEDEVSEEAKIVQSVNFCPVQIEEIQSVDSVPEGIKSLSPDENLELALEKEIPMPEDIISFCCDEERKSPSKGETFGVTSGQFGTETSYLPPDSDSEQKPCDFQNQIISPPYVQSIVECDNAHRIEAYPEVEMPRETNLFSTLREYLTESICLTVVEAVQGTKIQQLQDPPDTFTSQLPPSKHEASFEMHWPSLLRNTELASFDEKKKAAVNVIPKEFKFGCTLSDNDSVTDILVTEAGNFNSENTVGEVIPDTEFHQVKIIEEVSVDTVSDGEKQDECGKEYKRKLQAYQNAESCHEEGHLLHEIVEDIRNKCTDIEDIDPASFDEKGAAAVSVITKELEFECRIKDNDSVRDISTTKARIFNSENSSLPVGEVTSDTKCHQVKFIEEVAGDSLSDGDKQDECCKEYKPKLQAFVNAISCHDQGHSMNEIVEDIGNKCADIEDINPASFDEISAAAVAVIPKESEIGCTLRENDTVKDILTAGAKIFNFENTSLLVGEAIPDTKFHQIKIVEEVTVDSLSLGEKQDDCSEEYKSKLKLQAYLNVKSYHEQGHSLDEIVDDIGNKCTGSICPISLRVGSLNFSGPQESVLKSTNKEENQSPQSVIAVARCSEMEILENHTEAAEKNSTFGHILSRSKAASAPQIQTNNSRFKGRANVDTEVEMSHAKDIINKAFAKDIFSVFDGEEEIFTPDNENNIISKTMSNDAFSVSDGEEEEIFTPDKENSSPNTLHLRFLKKKGKLEENKPSKSKKSHNSKASLDICTDNSTSLTSNKENQIPKVVQEQKSQRKPLGSHINLAQEQDIATLKNKIKRVPFQSLMNSGGKSRSGTSGPISSAKSIGEIKHLKSQRLHNSKASPIIYPDESTSLISNIENQTLQIAEEQKSQRKPLASHINLAQEQDTMTLKNKLERVPFQSPMNSGGKNRSGISGPVSAAQGIDASNCGHIPDNSNPSNISGEQTRNWDMVVDTASLLNKESRKALQLLQGLKGTRLVIPRLVIRELDSMKRQFRIFRRVSEASLVLEWIEECMVKTKWWIHIQSSMDELEDHIHGSLQPVLSPHSSMEIASPAVEDHMLDCALLYRGKKNDRQVVLLSDDVALKIRSMGEGLLCETVQEFRQSLVNPFSERFMWAYSSPRGFTWSCQDDVVLREKYCGLPLRRSPKGLKLILLHTGGSV